jgi:hypothetical protein
VVDRDGTGLPDLLTLYRAQPTNDPRTTFLVDRESNPDPCLAKVLLGAVRHAWRWSD